MIVRQFKVNAHRAPEKILTLLQRVRQNHFARCMRIPRPRLALSWAKPDCRADGQPVVRDPLDKPSVFKCRRRLVAPSESARAHGHPPQAAGRPSWTQPPVAFTARRSRWNYPSACAFGSSALAGVQKRCVQILKQPGQTGASVAMSSPAPPGRACCAGPVAFILSPLACALTRFWEIGACLFAG
jgi:hypothetical protein